MCAGGGSRQYGTRCIAMDMMRARCFRKGGRRLACLYRPAAIDQPAICASAQATAQGKPLHANCGGQCAQDRSECVCGGDPQIVSNSIDSLPVAPADAEVSMVERKLHRRSVQPAIRRPWCASALTGLLGATSSNTARIYQAEMAGTPRRWQPSARICVACCGRCAIAGLNFQSIFTLMGRDRGN